MRAIAKTGLTLHIAARGEEAGFFRARSTGGAALEGTPTRLIRARPVRCQHTGMRRLIRFPDWKTILGHPDGTKLGLIGRRDSTSEAPGRNPTAADCKSPRLGSESGMRGANGECQFGFRPAKALLA